MPRDKCMSRGTIKDTSAGEHFYGKVAELIVSGSRMHGIFNRFCITNQELNKQ